MAGAAYKDDISLNSENSEEFVEGDLFERYVPPQPDEADPGTGGAAFYERYWKTVFQPHHVPPTGIWTLTAP